MERRYSMRIAVSYKDGEVFQHFGHSSEFKIYETDHNEIELTHSGECGLFF